MAESSGSDNHGFCYEKLPWLAAALTTTPSTTGDADANHMSKLNLTSVLKPAFQEGNTCKPQPKNLDAKFLFHEVSMKVSALIR